MSNLASQAFPEYFHSGWSPTTGSERPDGAAESRRSPRLGQRAILLSARNPNGAGILLAFTRTRGGIAFWRSLRPERSRLDLVGTFPGPFSPRAVARLLASGAARPAVDATLVEDTWVDGVDEPSADLLRLAWCRSDGQVDPRAVAVLALGEKTLAETCDRVEMIGVEGLLELGADILKTNAAWLARHRAAIDAEVDRRAQATSAGEQERRELRAFVEGCLLTLGRLPRADETAACWDGTGLEGRELGDRERRRLGLHQTGRAGRFRVWVQYWNAAESLGRGEFGSGAGWYWDVTNPDPSWRVDGIMGPCRSADDAWSDASCLEEQE